MAFDHLLDGVGVHRHVFANGSVRTTSRLHTNHPVRRDCAAFDDEFGILFGEYVVGDGGNRIFPAHFTTERHQECGLTRADGTAASNSDWLAHDAGSFPMLDYEMQSRVCN